jgi:hypothetical protein
VCQIVATVGLAKERMQMTTTCTRGKRVFLPRSEQAGDTVIVPEKAEDVCPPLARRVNWIGKRDPHDSDTQRFSRISNTEIVAIISNYVIKVKEKLDYEARKNLSTTQDYFGSL